MSKLFGLNKPNTNLRKNVFDLSEKNLYSSSVGLLTPLLCRELNPGEKVQVSVNALTRSMPLNTAAFVRSRQYFHYFFVPFRQLWSGWDNFINSVDYKTSSFQKDAIYSRIPGIDLFKSIADLLEDGYLTPAFNPATKQLEVPEGITIREYTTSYKSGMRKKKKSPYANISDADFTRYNYIEDLIEDGREINAEDRKFYREFKDRLLDAEKKVVPPPTPVVKWHTEKSYLDAMITECFRVPEKSGLDIQHSKFLTGLKPIKLDDSGLHKFKLVDEHYNFYLNEYSLVGTQENDFNAFEVVDTQVAWYNVYNRDKKVELEVGDVLAVVNNDGFVLVKKENARYLTSNSSIIYTRYKKFLPEEYPSEIKSKLVNNSLVYATDCYDLAYYLRGYVDFRYFDEFSFNQYVREHIRYEELPQDVNNSAVEAGQGKPISFAPENVNKTLDEQGYSLVTGISRLLDMLEYGFTYVEYDEETQSYTQKASTLVDLLDSLNSKKINVLQWLRSEKNKCVVNPFRLLAYQKIYSDFYKRDDYEATNPLHWNIDDFKRGSAVMDFDDNSRLLNMLRLRYRWHNKDYFTGVVPSELLGGLQGFNANSLGMFGDNMQIASDDNKVSVANGNVSTKGIRAMFALEKLMRLTRRAGGFDYISQTLAHYGFEPPRGRGDKVEFVGGTASNINISEVLSTADTSKGFTGQIYGRGIGSIDEKGKTEFTAKEHGILMCIASIVPDSDYSAEGLNSFNSKLQRGDYFQPEFQDLGLQPVFNYELYNRIYSDNMPENLRINKGVLGFSPRYAEYKSAYDKLHGEFRNGRELSAWSSVSNVTDTNQGVARNSLKINPGVFNRIFASVYNGHESTDQFLTSAQFECKIIRPMSVTGQNL